MDAPHQEGARPEVSLSLFRLTWPILLELLLFMLMGTSDTMMLSGVSDEAVGGVGVVNHGVFLCVLLMNVISNGSAIVVAQYLGANRRQDAARITALALTMNLMLGLVVSAGMLLVGDFILGWMIPQEQLLAHARTYLHIAGGFIFLQALINGCSSIIRTYGFTRQSMYVSLGMNVLHVACNYGLIFGHWGMPRMGVAGAAVSTGVSRAVALVVFVWMLYRVMDVRMVVRDYVTYSREYVSKILEVGIPSGIEQATYHSCQGVFVYFATSLGPAALISRQYALTLSQYIYLFSLAVGVGTGIVVGRMVGARRPDEAYRRALDSLKWAVAITVGVDLLAIALRRPLLGLFTTNAEIITLASQLIVLSLLLETGRSFNLVLVNALRAAGDARYTVSMGMRSMVGMSVPLAWVLVFHLQLGLPGIWLAVATDEWVRGLVFWYRWRSRAWEQKALVEPEEQAVPAAVGG